MSTQLTERPSTGGPIERLIESCFESDCHGFGPPEAAWSLPRVGGIHISVDIPEDPYFYLAGPMTGYPKFNFPEFERVAGILRERGYVIVTPHELDDALIYEGVTNSEHGDEKHLSSQSPLGFDLLRRDANIVMHPRCIGVIAIQGWQASFGAGQIELYLADRFGKQTLYFREFGLGNHTLEHIDYDTSMAAFRAQGEVVG